MVVTGSTAYFGPGPTATFILKTDTDLVSPPIIVAIDDIPAINFGIYPNPVTDNMAFIDAADAIKTIRLFDLSGRMVQYVNGENSPSQVIYIDPIPYGMYIVEVTTDEGVGRKKLLIAE